MAALPETRREVLAAVATASSMPIAFDIGLELNITTQQAAARLRAAEKAGQVASWRPGEGSEDPETYWELTPEGKALLADEGHRVELQFDGDAVWANLIHPEHGCKPPIDEESGEEIEGEQCWISGWFDEYQAELLQGKVTLAVTEEWDGDCARLHVNDRQFASTQPTSPSPVEDGRGLDGLRGDVEIRVCELLERGGLESAPENFWGAEAQREEAAWLKGRDDTLALVREEVTGYIAKALEEFSATPDKDVGEMEGPRGVDSGDLTRAILDSLELPADEPDTSSEAQMRIQAAVWSWFYVVCWNCKRRALVDQAGDWDERPCPDNGDYECSVCPGCVAKEAKADA